MPAVRGYSRTAPSPARLRRLRLSVEADLYDALRRSPLDDSVHAARAGTRVAPVELEVRLARLDPGDDERTLYGRSRRGLPQLEQVHVHTVTELVGGHGSLNAAHGPRVTPRRVIRLDSPAARTSARSVSAASPSVVAASSASHEPAAAVRTDREWGALRVAIFVRLRGPHAIIVPAPRAPSRASSRFKLTDVRCPLIVPSVSPETVDFRRVTGGQRPLRKGEGGSRRFCAAGHAVSASRHPVVPWTRARTKPSQARGRWLSFASAAHSHAVALCGAVSSASGRR
jgi:hypothetical protein